MLAQRLREVDHFEHFFRKKVAFTKINVARAILNLFSHFFALSSQFDGADDIAKHFIRSLNMSMLHRYASSSSVFPHLKIFDIFQNRKEYYPDSFSAI